MPPLRYVTPPDFYQTSNPHQTISVTSQHPAQQLVFPEGVTVHLLNLDANNTVYLGGNQSILAGDLNNTIPLVPGASYISAGNLPVYGICKSGLTALVARSPDAINYFVPAGTSISTGGILGEDPSSPAPVRLNGVVGAKSGPTAAFSPPASSLLVCIVNNPGGTLASSITVSDSGSHAWTRRISQDAVAGNPGPCTIFTTFLTTAPGSITVTAASSDANSVGLHFVVRVLNGANANQGSAATASNRATSVNQQASISTTQAGSWVYCTGTQETASDSAAIAGTTTIDDFMNTNLNTFDAIIGRQSSPTGTPGPTTLGWTYSGAGPFTFAALEILHS